MRLAEWMDREERSNRWMADKIGVTKGTVRRWRLGLGVPGIADAQKIAVVTDGEVSVGDWLPDGAAA